MLLGCPQFCLALVGEHAASILLKLQGVRRPAERKRLKKRGDETTAEKPMGAQQLKATLFGEDGKLQVYTMLPVYTMLGSCI